MGCCSVSRVGVKAAWVVVVSSLVVAGCGSSREVPGDTDSGAGDGGSSTRDGGSVSDGGGSLDGGEQCGATVCGEGMVCCNASCGICTPPNGSCIALECTDGGVGSDAGPCLTPILCAAPPFGCRYVGASCTSCGELVCMNGCGNDPSMVCGSGEYCRYERGCSSDDEPGMCEPRPDGCPDVYDPVCGCDGMTYGNACEAASQGVNVDSRGECGMAKRCGTIAGLACNPNEWCDYENCRIADAGGMCEPRPDACTREFAPVCGCDGQTYGNECTAHAAGVDVLHAGRCDRP